jgi:hypothetical protein
MEVYRGNERLAKRICDTGQQRVPTMIGTKEIEQTDERTTCCAQANARQPGVFRRGGSLLRTTPSRCSERNDAARRLKMTNIFLPRDYSCVWGG